MSSIKTAVRLLKTDRRMFKISLFSKFAKLKISHLLPDKVYLSGQYRAFFGKKLNWKDPKTFNEKLQWLKIYDRNPEYCTMVDKYDVRKYIAERIGEEYLIPCLGVWDNVEDIDFSNLPEKFVLKCTHDSGSVIICENKNDVANIKAKLAKKAKRNMFWWGREWPYKELKPRIIAEQFLSDESGELRDYKFFCFNGKPEMIYISQGLANHSTARISFFDLRGQLMPFRRSDFQAFNEAIKLPDNFEQMTQIVEKLAKAVDCAFVRIDLYSVLGKIYFSEITFYPAAGLLLFEPQEWDYKLGERIDLPEKRS